MKKGPSIAFRLTVYPLAVILFLLFSGLMVFFAAGYNLKYEDGRFKTQKTGVIIVGTRPGESVVTLDGEVYGKKTPSLPIFNLTIKRVIAGNHHLVVSHDGYEAWEGNVFVESGLVTWRDYLILLPTTRKADQFNLVGSVESQIVSKDQKRMVVLAVDRAQNVYNFWLVNTESKENTKIAEATFVSGDQYEIIGFAEDYSKYLYRKTDANKVISYMVAESKMSGLTYNLDALFSNQASKYYFSPYNNNELFFIQNSSVFKINLENKTESSVLAAGVVSAHSLKGQFLLVRKTEENYGLWVLSSNNELKNVAKAVPAADDYRIAYLETSKSYLIQELGDKDLLIYSNEIKNPTLETIARDVNIFSVSPTGERVAFYSENKLRVYSIKDEKYFDIADSEKINTIDWMQDGKNLIYGTDTEIRIVNYNGDYNKTMFVTVASSMILSPDNSYNIFFLDSVSEDRDLYSFGL